MEEAFRWRVECDHPKGGITGGGYKLGENIVRVFFFTGRKNGVKIGLYWEIGVVCDLMEHWGV